MWKTAMEGWEVTIPLFIKETDPNQLDEDVRTSQMEKEILIANYMEIENGLSPLKSYDENIKPAFSFIQTSPPALGQAMEFITKLLVELHVAENWVQCIISALVRLINVE